jgi:hypothetical protein
MQRFPSYFCNVLRVILSCSFCFQRRYANRPIVELEGAAQEELKITELRLAKLFLAETAAATTSAEGHISQQDKAAGIDQFYLLTQCVVKNLLFFLHLYVPFGYLSCSSNKLSSHSCIFLQW